VAEWSNAPHSKCGIRVTVSRVRIPASPPSLPEHLEIFQESREFPGTLTDNPSA